MRRKNSIETDNIRSHLPLSSCYFSCTRKILHSCTKEEKNSTAAELMKPGVLCALLFLLNLPSASSMSPVTVS